VTRLYFGAFQVSNVPSLDSLVENFFTVENFSFSTVAHFCFVYSRGCFVPTMKSSIVIGLLAAIAAGQQFQSEHADLDGGKTREQIGRKSIPIIDLYQSSQSRVDKVVAGGVAQRCRLSRRD
jgi:hypothetical protein